MSEVETKPEENKEQRDQTGAVLRSGAESPLKYDFSGSELSLRIFRDEAEIHAIRSALKQTGWNRKRAAQLLSISYRGLLYKIRRHNILPPAEPT
jgi:transcriptional regulator with GAF, ATPase, and Fis domain